MSEVQWYRELSAATVSAKSAQKPLLIDFYSDTCLGCEKMAAVTYRQAPVADLVNQHFVPLKLDVKEPKGESRELLRMAKPLFTPLLLFLDANGTEVRRFTGYLPPVEFLGELQFVLGGVDLLHTRFKEAYTRFRAIAEQYPKSHVAPEALYWAGVAAYRLNNRGLDALIPEWAELRARYQESTWWTRASCIAERIARTAV
jgi:thioredoxin-related protein